MRIKTRYIKLVFRLIKLIGFVRKIEYEKIRQKKIEKNIICEMAAAEHVITAIRIVKYILFSDKVSIKLSATSSQSPNNKQNAAAPTTTTISFCNDDNQFCGCYIYSC